MSSYPPNSRVTIAKTTPNTVAFNIPVIESIEGRVATWSSDADNEFLVRSPDQQHPYNLAVLEMLVPQPYPRPTEPETLALAQ